MDFATIFGIILFIGMAVRAITWHEGMAGLKPFANVEAALVVMGGTLCALLVNYDMKQVLGVFKVLKKVLSTTGEDTSQLVNTFMTLSQKAKKDGFLALENDVKNINNDFLKRALQMVIDGADQEFITNMLETEIGFIRERHKVGREIFNSLGTYAPAFGIIGTIMGMIIMMNSISDVEEVPRRMALALSAAFIGLGAGYLVFLPMAGKLHGRSEEELLVKEIIIRGVLLIQSGATPSLVEANLKAYLDPSKRASIAKKAE
jgi:chemotaxis protein MotA